MAFYHTEITDRAGPGCQGKKEDLGDFGVDLESGRLQDDITVLARSRAGCPNPALASDLGGSPGELRSFPRQPLPLLSPGTPGFGKFPQGANVAIHLRRGWLGNYSDGSTSTSNLCFILVSFFFSFFFFPVILSWRKLWGSGSLRSQQVKKVEIPFGLAGRTQNFPH